MSDQEMIERLVSAAERGFPGDRVKQVQQVAAHSLQAPFALTGVFLGALKIITDRATLEAEGSP
jgi:hypothetical protein